MIWLIPFLEKKFTFFINLTTSFEYFRTFHFVIINYFRPYEAPDWYRIKGRKSAHSTFGLIRFISWMNATMILFRKKLFYIFKILRWSFIKKMFIKIFPKYIRVPWAIKRSSMTILDNHIFVFKEIKYYFIINEKLINRK